jgi:glycolate oxidase FAD binding subunit
MQDPQSERVEIPGAIVEQFDEPSTREELVEAVSEAARDRTGLLITGGRTRLHWANPARGIVRGLSLRGLSGIDEFEPDEGVLHAAAGTPIRALRRAAAAEGWELPLDPPAATSTLGGTISSAAIGPRAHTLGRVADAILGLDVVGGDGVVSKCGGRVVKNVTGYDLAKLYCGSFGTLAVITGAWLRLRPAPAVKTLLSGRPSAGREAFDPCRRLSQCASVRALVWNESPTGDPAELIVELGGSEAGVRHDRERVESVLAVAEDSPDRIDALRDARGVQGGDGVVLRARVLGTVCRDMIDDLLGLGLSVSVDLGLAMIEARGHLDDPRQLTQIRKLATDRGGLVVFEALPDTWRSELDVFGDVSGTASLTSNLKRRFDPAGILNPGRFVAGT